MNRLALKNIFKLPEPNSRFVVVVKRIGTNKYQTQDQYKRFYNVTATITLLPGDNVEIQSGKVIAKTGKQPTPVTYSV